MNLKLFTTHVGVYQIDDSESINREILCIDGLLDNKYNFRNYLDIWQLRDQVPALDKLYHAFLHNAASYANECYDLQYESSYFQMLEGWCSLSLPHNQIEKLHNHRLTDVAAVYYTQVTDQTGDIEFYDPRGGLGFVSLDSAKPYNIHRHTPKTGQMILFPGWLLHTVCPNDTNTARVAIATNIKLREEIRYKKYTRPDAVDQE
jgi:uncharacterized protein (TIGR02466 family)